MYKKCIVVLICLFMVGNLAQGRVLCFGADGHIEIKFAFHEQCDDPVHSYVPDQNQHSYQADREKGKHCEPCVDVPFSTVLAKISHASKRLNFTFPVPATSVIVATDKLNFSAYNLASEPFMSTPFFTPLRSIILLI